jgi:hypothetical protein
MQQGEPGCKERLSQSAHFKRALALRAKVHRAEHVRIAPGLAAAASAICTPVHTGHSASCSTLAVLEPRMKRRNSPQPWVGIRMRSHFFGVRELDDAERRFAIHIPGGARCSRRVPRAETCPARRVRLSIWARYRSPSMTPPISVSPRRYCMGASTCSRMISGEKRCARRLAQWTAPTERSEKSTGNKIFASGSHGLPPGRRTAATPHRLPPIRVIRCESLV